MDNDDKNDKLKYYYRAKVISFTFLLPFLPLVIYICLSLKVGMEIVAVIAIVTGILGSSLYSKTLKCLLERDNTFFCDFIVRINKRIWKDDP